MLWGGAVLLVIILLVFAGIEYILHSDRAHQYILNTAQTKAREALGSDVKVGNYALNFSGISPTLDLYNVVINGADPYPTPPLLTVDHIRVGVRIVSVVHKKWYLSDVTVDRPIVRVFVDKQGKDNLPQTKSSGQKSNTNIFDLAVQHARIDRGEVYYNNRKSVLNADLHDVDFQSGFDNAARRYSGRLAYSNGHLQMENFNSIGHDLVAFFDLDPDKAVLKNAVLRSGNSQITMNATVLEYSSETPKLAAEYVAKLDAGEFRHILKNPTLPAGLVDINGKVSYTAQPNKPMLDLMQVHGQMASKLLSVTTPSFRGEIRNVGANYSLQNGNVNVRQMHANVLGGELNGELTMRDIAGNSKSHLTATLKGVSLGQAKSMMSAPALKQVGLTGAVNANADATWGKTFNDLVAKADATLKAMVIPPKAGAQAVPVNGVVHATYSAPNKQITLTNTYVNMPQASLNMNGTVSERSSLQVKLQANDLHQIETIASMFQTNPQPLGLFGAANFNGAITGSTSAPRITGQLIATNLQVKGSSWKLLRTNVDASPSEAVLQNGELDPAAKGKITFSLRAGLKKWSFTKDSPFQVALNANQLDVQNLAKAAGSQAPVTGTLNVNVQARGTQLNPVGNGTIELTQAKVSGEPIQAATVKFQGTGDVVHTNLALKLPAGSATGAVDYFPKNQGYSGQIQANGIRLDQLQTVKAKNLDLRGVVNLNATGRGTVQNPQLVATVEIPSIVAKGQKIDGIKLQTNIANHVANVELDSQALNTNLRGRATINLTGNYETVASLDTQPIPFAPLVAVYAPEQAGNIAGQTEIHATLRGPLKNKSAVNAQIVLPMLQVSYKNAVQIGAPQPIRATYTNGVLELQRASLTGTGTNLQIQGRVPVVDTNAPVSLLLQGTVDLRLAQLINPDLASSGQLQFDINSYGQRSDPNVQGQIKVVNASFATGSAPLGLQNGNGVLTLTRNRLNIDSFQGEVGGGRVIARGGVAYRPAIGFDLALTARNIRLLYPENVRSGLGGNITLTGTPDAAYLRGQVNLQQLSFTPDFDLMGFMGTFGGGVVSPPPSQGFADNLQLDLHVSTPNGIDLSSRELSLSGGVNLNVRGTANDPVILGRVNLNEGDLIFRGNRYLLQGSTIDFVNPVRTEPVVNATINTAIQQYNIAMRFEGPVDHLRTSYTSDPALPPADIINLLAFGKTTEAAAANPNPPGALGAQSAIASAVAGQVTSRMAKVAGISQLSVDPTLGGNGTGQSKVGAVITIQQRVTSKVFVTFSTDVTSTERQVMQLEYRVTPRFSVSGTRDQNGGFAVDTKIHKQW